MGLAGHQPGQLSSHAGAFLGGLGRMGKQGRLGAAVSADRLEFTAGPPVVCDCLRRAFKWAACGFSVLPLQGSSGLVLPSEQARGSGDLGGPPSCRLPVCDSGGCTRLPQPSQVRTLGASAWVTGLWLVLLKLRDDVYADTVRCCFIASCFRCK